MTLHHNSSVQSTNEQPWNYIYSNINIFTVPLQCIHNYANNTYFKVEINSGVRNRELIFT